jgi:hypothetical protein
VPYGVEEESNTDTSEIALESDDKRGVPNSRDRNQPPQGIAMLKNDISEIQLLIRKGAPVTIILNQDEKRKQWSTASGVAFSPAATGLAASALHFLMVGF